MVMGHQQNQCWLQRRNIFKKSMYRMQQEECFNLKFVITVLADVLVPKSARPSAALCWLLSTQFLQNALTVYDFQFILAAQTAVSRVCWCWYCNSSLTLTTDKKIKHLSISLYQFIDELFMAVWFCWTILQEVEHISIYNHTHTMESYFI